jgi:hypothetical protein
MPKVITKALSVESGGVSSNLSALAAIVRAGLTASAHALNGVLGHALDIGDALLAAKSLCGHGRWLPWLESECGLSSRTAEIYMRLAHHRARIEAETSNLQHAANLSLRAALRLIGSGRTYRPRRRVTLNPAMWKAASVEERADFVDGIPLTEWLQVIPSSWRTEIIDRVDGLRAVQAKPIATVH